MQHSPQSTGERQAQPESTNQRDLSVQPQQVGERYTHGLWGTTDRSEIIYNGKSILVTHPALEKMEGARLCNAICRQLSELQASEDELESSYDANADLISDNAALHAENFKLKEVIKIAIKRGEAKGDGESELRLYHAALNP